MLLRSVKPKAVDTYIPEQPELCQFRLGVESYWTDAGCGDRVRARTRYLAQLLHDLGVDILGKWQQDYRTY
jgi:hypothetical protein